MLGDGLRRLDDWPGRPGLAGPWAVALPSRCSRVWRLLAVSLCCSSMAATSVATVWASGSPAGSVRYAEGGSGASAPGDGCSVGGCGMGASVLLDCEAACRQCSGCGGLTLGCVAVQRQQRNGSRRRAHAGWQVQGHDEHGMSGYCGCGVGAMRTRCLQQLAGAAVPGRQQVRSSKRKLVLHGCFTAVDAHLAEV
jgi:hypothetical protein